MSTELDVEYARAASLVGASRWADALARLDALIASAPDHADGFALRAMCLIALQRYPEALESARRALAVEPDHVSAHLQASRALRVLSLDERVPAPERMELAARADAHITTCRRLVPNDPYSAYIGAVVSSGDDAAEEHARDALRLSAGGRWGRLAAAAVAIRLKKWPDARQHLLAELAESPDDPFVLDQLATAELAAGNHEDAIRRLLRATSHGNVASRARLDSAIVSGAKSAIPVASTFVVGIVCIFGLSVGLPVAAAIAMTATTAVVAHGLGVRRYTAVARALQGARTSTLLAPVRAAMRSSALVCGVTALVLFVSGDPATREAAASDMKTRETRQRVVVGYETIPRPQVPLPIPGRVTPGRTLPTAPAPTSAPVRIPRFETRTVRTLVGDVDASLAVRQTLVGFSVIALVLGLVNLASPAAAEAWAASRARYR